MATNTIRLSDGVKEETCRIAGQMGLTFNSVVNILLKKFNETKGFPSLPSCVVAALFTTPASVTLHLIIKRKN